MRMLKEEKKVNILGFEVFEDLRSSLGSSLETALKVADDQHKEVVLTIKINVSTSHQVDNDRMLSWTEPNIDYKVTRTIKESKFDFGGDIKKSAMRIIDGDVFIEVLDDDKPIQLALFDKIDEKYDV